MKYDVTVIGGGVIGAFVARTLSRYQLNVCVVEKENDVARGASGANSGIVHGGHDPKPGTLKALLNAKGVPALFQAAKELCVPIIKNGSMVCAFSEEDRKHLRELLLRGEQNGIKDLTLLSGEEARNLEPALSDQVKEVLLVPEAGIVNPYELTIAAMGNAMDNGVRLQCNFTLASISKKDGAFLLTDEKGVEIESEYIVNCAGTASDRIAAMVGDHWFSIIPRKGEYLLLDREKTPLCQHTLFVCPGKEGKGILVSPTTHNNLLLGPTAQQVLSEDDTETSAEGLRLVEKGAGKLTPSVNLRKVITSFAGVRASTQSGDFILTAGKKEPKAIHAAAIDSPGLTCCVSIAQRVIELLQGAGLATVEKKNWNPHRKDLNAFRKLSEEEKDAVIRSHPEYGRVLCRCENISLGEVLEAMNTNPKPQDLDGIKKRVRSGMGRCQGGFCSPSIATELAKHLGIPLEQITKSGEGSHLLAERICKE